MDKTKKPLPKAAAGSNESSYHFSLLRIGLAHRRDSQRQVFHTITTHVPDRMNQTSPVAIYSDRRGSNWAIPNPRSEKFLITRPERNEINDRLTSPLLNRSRTCAAAGGGGFSGSTSDGVWDNRSLVYNITVVTASYRRGGRSQAGATR